LSRLRSWCWVAWQPDEVGAHRRGILYRSSAASNRQAKTRKSLEAPPREGKSSPSCLRHADTHFCLASQAAPSFGRVPSLRSRSSGTAPFEPLCIRWFRTCHNTRPYYCFPHCAVPTSSICTTVEYISWDWHQAPSPIEPSILEVLFGARRCYVLLRCRRDSHRRAGD
jgi:hypothetical protein